MRFLLILGAASLVMVWSQFTKPQQSASSLSRELVFGRDEVQTAIQIVQNQKQKRGATKQTASGSGVASPRARGCDGAPLPSPRKVSLHVHTPASNLDPENTLMVMLWGQYLAHDIELTPAPESDEELLGCANCLSEGTNSNCFPIPVPANDPRFKDCLPFVRSKGGQLAIGQRQQQNAISSFIDASNLYSASSVLLGQALRSFKDGKLVTGEDNLLPNDPATPSCDGTSRNSPCFLAGDVRNSQNAALTSMHTLWLREHNRIAEELKTINGHWNDSRLFQETRRIVIALNQRITYNEFLTSLLSKNIRKQYKIQEEHGTSYFQPENDSKCDATTLNEFSTAAFRIGHTLIEGFFKRISIQTNINSKYFLNGTWFRTSIFHKDKDLLATILHGISNQSCQGFDKHFDAAVQQHLFESFDDTESHSTASPCDPKRQARMGTDLISLNIQRGRDHGLQPYTAYRGYFNLSVPKSFSHLHELDLMDCSTVIALQEVYNSVHDIDLFTGIVSEKSPKDAIVGELGSHIIAEQFRRLKHCDRHFYSSVYSPGKFTPDQLRSIRGIRLRDVICNHINKDSKMQGDVFMRSAAFNERKTCGPRRNIDFTYWKEPSNFKTAEPRWVSTQLCPIKFVAEEEQNSEDPNIVKFY